MHEAVGPGGGGISPQNTLSKLNRATFHPSYLPLMQVCEKCVYTFLTTALPFRLINYKGDIDLPILKGFLIYGNFTVARGDRYLRISRQEAKHLIHLSLIGNKRVLELRYGQIPIRLVFYKSLS